MGGNRIEWKIARFWLRRMVRRTATRVLLNRTLISGDVEHSRWLKSEIADFVTAVEEDVAALRPMARLDELPTFGNRLMVEMTIYTIAAGRELRRAGVESDRTLELVSDLGWDIYRRMLGLYSLPFRLLTRDPSRRLRWTVRMLLRFPFNAPGAPGYEVKTWQEGSDIFTHFTSCPPQTFARRLAQDTEDDFVLALFRRSWCTYDWPGADLIAGDGTRGHYHRRHTLSHGDGMCDMCWAGRPNGMDNSQRGGTT